jgi:NADH-quinone oxidoreductase subunit L
MIDFALNNAWLIPLLPAIAFLLIALVFKPLPKVSAFIAISCILMSFVLAICVGIGVIQHGDQYVNNPLRQTVTWFGMEGLKVEMGVQLDPTSAMMLFVVGLVASLVQIYSLGYMRGDPGFSTFYAYLSLFAMSMLGLVIAPNLLQMFVFWELVGLCSYLLIGFWFHKYSAREAAKKAFITTRTGDFGLLLGILLLQINFGTLDLVALGKAIPNFAQYGLTAGTLTIIAVVLFLGPIGKSGQFPLHVWLPDAMEGPTPVSALIHAATMVVAGVYLVGRSLILFKTVPGAMAFVAFVGAFTALFAASVAITQTEMKKILAYSTVSQLGYMMLALGAGSLAASMFHLMTHAFFKALMFLGAGSVLHAMSNEASIWKYGGLKKYMPITYWTFLVGCLAIAGIFPFAGFFSKDLILEVVYLASSISSYPPTSQYPAFYTMLLVMAFATAMMTAFYMFRMFFICFHGELRDKHAHPHESPFSMTMPLVILCILSICGGWVGWPGLGAGQSFGYFVRVPGEAFHVVHANWFLIIMSTVLALIGIGGATAIYLKKSISHEELAKKLAPLYKLSFNKFYIDEIYLWFIHNVIDGLGKFLWWVDITIVDGIIDGIGSSAEMLGSGLRKVQTGKLQHYALIFFAGIVILVLLMSFTNTSSASLGLLGGVR